MAQVNLEIVLYHIRRTLHRMATGKEQRNTSTYQKRASRSFREARFCLTKSEKSVAALAFAAVAAAAASGIAALFVLDHLPNDCANNHQKYAANNPRCHGSFLSAPMRMEETAFAR